MNRLQALRKQNRNINQEKFVNSIVSEIKSENRKKIVSLSDIKAKFYVLINKTRFQILLFILFLGFLTIFLIPNIFAFQDIQVQDFRKIGNYDSNIRYINFHDPLDTSVVSTNTLVIIQDKVLVDEMYLMNISDIKISIYKFPKDMVFGAKFTYKYLENLQISEGLFFDSIIVVEKGIMQDIYDELSISNTQYDVKFLEIVKNLRSITSIFKYSKVASLLRFTMYTNYTNEQIYVLFNKLSNQEIIIVKNISNITKDPNVFRDQARVEVTNASSIPGYATQFSKILGNTGMNIAKVRNFDFETGKNIIMTSSEDKYKATIMKLKRIFPDAEVRYDEVSKLSTADVLVLLGK